ncbi:hypothetical protein [Bhargavaea massiliensis]|uniref:hypothetical protein n=1 Tax=Bhargavaea massiliensis TaxID=2697500 RepID=UPI001BCD343E|nr:hypothetical protein [Bhargavaea massiliensis]
MNPMHVPENVKPLGHYEIVDTGWREDDLYVVILGAEEPALLENSEASAYARMVARRRRHSTPVTTEPVEPATGKLPYQRMFCFK